MRTIIFCFVIIIFSMLIFQNVVIITLLKERGEEKLTRLLCKISIPELDIFMDGNNISKIKGPYKAECLTGYRWEIEYTQNGVKDWEWFPIDEKWKASYIAAKLRGNWAKNY